MSDLYVLTVWKNGWAYAAPINDASEVPDAVVDYTRTMTRAEALLSVLEAPIPQGVVHGRKSQQSQRPQF